MGAYHQPMLGKTNGMLPNDFPSLFLATRLWEAGQKPMVQQSGEAAEQATK